MNAIASQVIRFFGSPHADRSLQAVALLSCFGLALSLVLVGLGIDLGGNWL